MPLDDVGDLNAELRQIRKDIQRLHPTVAGADSSHAGDGPQTVQVGEGAAATVGQSVAVGADAVADGNSTAVGCEAEATDSGTALGRGAVATGGSAVALGYSTADGAFGISIGLNARADAFEGVALGHSAVTDNAYEIALGRAAHTVVVKGTFSNPSARRLKRDIVPAPPLRSIFPELVEYAYIADETGKRRLGYIADDLVGSDAERFVVFGDDGKVAGIAYLEMLVAQVARLHAEITMLKNELRERNG